jgi:hypothetical protein
VADTSISISEEEQAQNWEALLDRLNHQSVVKHFDAYADVAWDDPEFAIDPDDPRWELGDEHPLAATDWYRSQPPGTRSRIGLHMIASSMQVGLQFESVLKRGLLEYAFALPNNAPEYRYAYHEVIEEAHHSLMFQEFINRSGFDIPGLPGRLRRATRRVVMLGRLFPELFFVFVLGGEDPIDDVQRTALRRGGGHPLLERIMRIHVTEEARHLSFARHYLKKSVPALNPAKRAVLAVGAPVILGVMAQLMLKPSKTVIRTYGIPADVIQAAYDRNPEHRAQVANSLRKVRSLLDELGLITVYSRPIWRRFGLFG